MPLLIALAVVGIYISLVAGEAVHAPSVWSAPLVEVVFAAGGLALGAAAPAEQPPPCRP